MSACHGITDSKAHILRKASSHIREMSNEIARLRQQNFKMQQYFHQQSESGLLGGQGVPQGPGGGIPLQSNGVKTLSVAKHAYAVPRTRTAEKLAPIKNGARQGVLALPPLNALPIRARIPQEVRDDFLSAASSLSMLRSESNSQRMTEAS